MDRKAWIAIIFSVVGLGAWQWYYVKTYSAKPAPESVTAGATAEPTAPRAEPTATAGSMPSPEASATAAAEVTSVSQPAGPVMTARRESLSNQNAEYVFSNDLGGIEQATLLLHFGEHENAVFINGSQSLPIGAIGAIGETPGTPWGGFVMVADRGKREVLFTRKDADGLETIKRFHVTVGDRKADLYRVRMELEFRNIGKEQVTRPGYFVSTGGAAPIHAKDLPMYTKFNWMHGDGDFEKIDVNWFNASSVPLLGIPIREARSIYEESKPDVQWAAVASQYFCSIVTTERTKGVSTWASRFKVPGPDATSVEGIQGGLGMPDFTLAPGQELKESFLIYIGPKELSRLEKLGDGQDEVMSFGIFGIVSKFLLWGMNRLQGVLHNYALSIIVLTLLIKSALWPIQNKATNQMRKMSLLSPKMTEVREKYKDDPQKMNTKMMELYKDYGVNPLSGCLPMLIQIPIFFGFYTMLGSAIELRNSHFLWISDLSQPDTIAHIPGLNFPVNLLPILMAGTMIWQMAISPKSGDAMQQRMFYFMPVIFLVFCYNYASALALYWTTQNIFSIVQLYLTRNKPLPTLTKKSAPPPKPGVKSVKNKMKRPGS